MRRLHRRMWKDDCFYYICRPEWEHFYQQAAMQLGVRAVAIRDTKVDQINFFACLFVDLEFAVDHPELLQWAEAAEDASNTSLFVVPYFVGKSSPDLINLIKQYSPTIALYQSKSWAKEAPVDKIASALWRGRWKVNQTKSANMGAVLFTLIDLPFKTYYLLGFHILPALYCILHWLLPATPEIVLAVVTVGTIGPWIEAVLRYRTDRNLFTQPPPLYRLFWKSYLAAFAARASAHSAASW